MGMRIRPTDVNAALLNRVQEKRDGAGQQSADQQQKQDQNSEQPRFEVTDETVQGAMETFANDKQVIESGLSAEAVGKGPGLKVILKDGSGRMLRQMTGEEFVKLKETLTDKQAHSGKILDQKF